MTAYQDHRDEAIKALDSLHDDITDGASYDRYQYCHATVHSTLAVAAALTSVRRAILLGGGLDLGEELSDAWLSGPQSEDELP